MIVDLLIVRVCQISKGKISKLTWSGQVDNVIRLLIAEENQVGSFYFDDNYDLAVKDELVVKIVDSVCICDCVWVDGVAGMYLEDGKQTENIVNNSVLVDRIEQLCQIWEKVVEWG